MENILENIIIYDVSATITQDERNHEATFDPDRDMDDSESEVDGTDELALVLVYLDINIYQPLVTVVRGASLTQY